MESLRAPVELDSYHGGSDYCNYFTDKFWGSIPHEDGIDFESLSSSEMDADARANSNSASNINEDMDMDMDMDTDTISHFDLNARIEIQTVKRRRIEFSFTPTDRQKYTGKPSVHRLYGSKPITDLVHNSSPNRWLLKAQTSGHSGAMQNCDWNVLRGPSASRATAVSPTLSFGCEEASEGVEEPVCSAAATVRVATASASVGLPAHSGLDESWSSCSYVEEDKSVLTMSMVVAPEERKVWQPTYEMRARKALEMLHERRLRQRDCP